MSSIKEPSAIKIGDFVQFTLSDDVSIIYSGRVTGIATYDVARSLGADLAARHEQIKAVKPDIVDVINQRFLIVDIGSTMPLAAAFDWIEGNSVEVIEQGATYSILLVNCSKEKANEAITILRSNGISCKLSIEH